MNHPRFSPDDPILTAYALGELDAAETARVELALRSDPVARKVVDDARTASMQIKAALHAEAARVEAADDAAETAPQVRAADSLVRHHARPRGWARLLRFPNIYYLVSGSAAAAFAILALVQPANPPVGHMAEVYGELTAERRARAISEARANALRERLARIEAQLGAAAAAAAAAGAAQSAAAADAAVATPAAAEVEAANQPPVNPSIRLAGNVSPRPRVALPPPEPTRLPIALQGEFVNPGSIAAGAIEDMKMMAASNLAGNGMAAPSAPLILRGRVDLYPRPGWFAARVVEDFMRSPGSVAARESGAAESSTRPENEFRGVWYNPYSSFTVDVGTGSYSVVRRFLQGGRLPPADSVRIEELLNYFPYSYTPPIAGANAGENAPFAAALEVSEAPWAPYHRLVRIGLKGREASAETRAPANLVFLLDVSASMTAPNKLPVVKRSIQALLGKLRPDDRVAFVTYGARSGLALPSTPAANGAEIQIALEALMPRISANGAVGINLAYDIAEAHFASGGINRVVLCSDGDFHLGVASEVELLRLVEEKARAGVFLTVLGIGMGDYGDAMLEKLADKGRGHYGYVDSAREAEYVLDEQINSAHVAIASDVKVQIEFNPLKVSSYRLIGFENRQPANRNADNNRTATDEVGVGHTVTALYEIVPADFEDLEHLSEVDDLKYQDKPVKSRKALSPTVQDELLTVYVRYKDPASGESRQLDFVLKDNGGRFADASPDFKFAAAVAQFGMQLRKSPHKGVATVQNVIDWAAAGTADESDDPGSLRREFIDLLRQTEVLLQ